MYCSPSTKTRYIASDGHSLYYALNTDLTAGKQVVDVLTVSAAYPVYNNENKWKR